VSEGKVIAAADSVRLFEGVPLLGQKFNDALTVRDRVAARSTIDRMTAARFEAPEARLQGRKRFLIRVEEMSGPVSEIAEN